MVEEDILAYDRWGDRSFVEELERREKTYKNGTAKMFTLEESIKRSKQVVKKVKASKGLRS